ncbi:MAG: InlB B-repeat-containing protein, partial [Spirochaetaceae bacterium]|nr:InlB B-repeat-containing protein [Spirochaetaceae bacterium]
MKSKSSLFSAIALVAIAGFFFTACPQSGEDEDTTPATFTVTFNVNGGSAVAPISDVASGAKISKPADPAKKDSTFVGWYKEAALTTAWNFNSDTVTADITLYAKWGASKASIAAGAAVGTDA